jgi:hypothetical protein
LDRSPSEDSLEADDPVKIGLAKDPLVYKFGSTPASEVGDDKRSSDAIGSEK